MSTCTAPGHPGCSITCANGCGAIYSEPNGPCNTFCSGDDLTALELGDAPFSIHLSDFPAEKLARVLPGFGEALRGMSGAVSLSHTGVTRDQLPALIRKALG